MKKIVVIGSINVDLVFHVENFVKAKETISSKSMSRFLGGKGLNQAIALSKAYPEVRLFGNISKSDNHLKEEIKSFGVSTELIESLDGDTGTAFIQVDKTGQNCIVLNKGVNHCFEKIKINEVLSSLHPGDMIVLQNEINELEYIIQSAKENGIKIAFNPSPFESKILDLPLGDTDFLIFNEVEGKMLAHFNEPDLILKTLHNRYPNTVLVLTLGADGVMAQADNVTYEIPSHKVQVVDTTAAGDAFSGYFLAGIQKGLSVIESLEMANAAGALTVTKAGASSSIPALPEVLDAVVGFKNNPKKIKQVL
jgi:ribokinase